MDSSLSTGDMTDSLCLSGTCAVCKTRVCAAVYRLHLQFAAGRLFAGCSTGLASAGLTLVGHVFVLCFGQMTLDQST